MRNHLYYCLTALVLCACLSPQKRLSEKQELEWWSKATEAAYGHMTEKRQDGPLLAQIDSLRSVVGKQSVVAQSFMLKVRAECHMKAHGDFVSAARSLDSALNLFVQPEVRDQYPLTFVELSLNAGKAALQLGLLDKASAYFLQAKHLADRHLSPMLRGNYLYHVAMVLFQQNRFERSADLFRQALQQKQSVPVTSEDNALHIQEIMANIGLCYLELGQFDSARRWVNQARTYAQSQSVLINPRLLQSIDGVHSGHLGKISLREQRPEAAVPLLQNSIRLNDMIGAERSYTQSVRMDLARAYLQQKRLNDGHQQLQVLRRQLDTLPNPGVLRDWHELMYQLARTRNRLDTALHHLIAFERIKDSFEIHRREQTRLDLLQRLRERDLQLQVTQLKGMRIRNERQIILLGGAVALLSLASFFALLHSRRQKRHLRRLEVLNQEIEARQQELRLERERRHQLVVDAVMRAQEKDRSAIGKELHDNINQMLTMVKLSVELVRDGIGERQHLIDRSIHFLQQSIQEIRNLSRRLSAPSMPMSDLAASVEDLTASVNALEKIRITYELHGLPSSRPLRSEIQTTVYRIIQEAINNTLKHADARNLHIFLEVMDDRLLMLITDDGKGLPDEADTREGLGLANMRNRAESHGGSFSVSNGAEGGVVICVELPDILAQETIISAATV